MAEQTGTELKLSGLLDGDERIVSAELRARPGIGGQQARITFRNGYGASVVHGWGTHGIEMAVLDRNGELTYDTPVTSDTIGWLDRESLLAALSAVAALPEAPGSEDGRALPV